MNSINKDKENQLHLSQDWKLANLEGLPIELFKENRERFIENIKKRDPSFLNSPCCLILEGGKELPRYDTDTVCYHFIQESNFYYLTGITYPNYILVLDLNENILYLFQENPSLVTKIFQNVRSNEYIKEKYQCECKYNEEINDFLKSKSYANIYTLKGVNTDSGLEVNSFKAREDLKIVEEIHENEFLYEVLADTRTVKSQLEISVMAYSSKIAVEGHIEVMKNMKIGLIERDIENIFLNYLRNNYYSRENPYNPICGCGINAATLHYNKNDEVLHDGQMMLFDMGFRLAGYCSDVTSTIPVNGKFSKRQKEIYDIVLKANREVIKCLKAGILWSDMHNLSERIILEGLQKQNLVYETYSIDELLENRVSFYFYPHGLGHLIGLEVHDAGGYLSFTNPRASELGKRSLRTARVMEKGTMITVEPGLYFIPFHLEKAFVDEKIKKYFNVDECRKYYDFGGVRIEDVVLVEEDGCLNLCSELPRTTEEIEKAMKE